MADDDGNATWTVAEAAAFIRDELRVVAQKWWTPPPGIVAKLPRGGRDPSARCSVCGGWHKTGAIHLDFVGHADLTRALIEIDPEWQWEPVSFDEEGLPRITQRGGMLVLWGRLTLLGKTMLAVGTCEVTKTDADKELVGDMLRNGGMRFGIFGALWSKTDGWHDDDASPNETAPPVVAQPGAPTIVGPHIDSGSASGADSYALAAATPPEKPLAAMTAGEMARYGELIRVRVSGNKSEILRQLEPYVKAAEGTEPFGLDGERTGPREDPHDKEFSPVVAGSATVRTGVNSSLAAEK